MLTEGKLTNESFLIHRNECLKEFHEQGGSPQVIEDALSRIPMDPAMIQSCQRLKTNGWTLAIVSDANSVYIEGILEVKNCR